MKRIISALLVALLMFSFVSCMGNSAKTFTSNGMSITLTNAFKENTYEGYTVCYESKDVAVFVLKEAFSLQEGFDEMSLDDYAELVYAANASKSPSKISKEDGLTFIEYDFHNEEENQTYSYYTVMFKGTDAFWLVQFTSKKEDYDAKRQSFVDWAKTVEFDS